MAKRNNSNRVYELRICVNPSCKHSKEYMPTWESQIYCCRSCQINFNNDKAKTEKLTSHTNEKLLRGTDKRIGILHKKTKAHNFPVTAGLLVYDDIDPALSTYEETNAETGRQIRWIYKYGLEYVPEKKQYIIHKKTNHGKPENN